MRQITSLEFFGKPNCLTNIRQRKMLKTAGVELIEYDLLKTSWTESGLFAFLSDLPVSEWFNLSAPAVKTGELVPTSMTATEALKAMCANPILIRRPLLRYQRGYEDDIWYACGFDRKAIEQLLGVRLSSPDEQADEGCSHPQKLAAGQG